MRDLVWRLERAEARNTLACARARAELYDFTAECRWIAGGYSIFAGHWTHLTQAVAVGVSGPVEAGGIAALREYFEERLAIPTVHVSDCLPQVVCAFAKQGFRELGKYSVLVRRAEAVEAAPDGVAQTAATEAWIRAVCEGFGNEEVGRTMARVEGTTRFVACGAAGEVRGTAALSCHSRVGVLFADSTPPEFRGQGVQSRLIQARMARAARAGCDVVMAVTEPGSGSERNYLRQGFTRAYRRVVLQK